MNKTLIMLGLLLLPTPPSPVPDWGLQFVISFIIGILSPWKVVDPISRFIRWLGRLSVRIFTKIPVIRNLVLWLEKKYNGFCDFLEKKGNKRIQNIVPRLFFGYCVTCLVGCALLVVGLYF